MNSHLRSHHLSAILTTSSSVYDWSEADFVSVLKSAALTAKLTPVAEVAVTFQPQGVSAVLLLEESHVALHFWPEKRKVSVDIHVCDYHQDNRDKAKTLADILTLKLSENSQKESWKYLEMIG